jgi:hypothetical protein
MQIIITGIGLLSAFGIVILLGLFPDMSNDDKVPILTVFVSIATFSLIKMKSKDTKSGKRQVSNELSSRSFSPDHRMNC